MGNKVEIEIILKGAQAAKELKGFSADAADGLKKVKTEAKDAAKGLKGTSDATGGLSKALDGLKVAAIVTAAAFSAWKGLKEIVGFLKDAGTEAAGQELALKSLHTTLVAAGRATGDFERDIIKLSEAMQAQTGFSDDLIESAARILSPYENITNDLFPRTLQATVDLARALQIDLPEAARMVGMASLGMTRGLKQIGIDIDEAQFKSIGFAGVLEQLETKVKGQADAYRATSTGLSEYIKTMWGEVKEQFGTIVNQVLKPFKEAAGEVLSALASQLEDWVKTVDLKKWAEDAAKNFKDLTITAIPDLIKQLDLLIPKITSGAESINEWISSLNKTETIGTIFTLIKAGVDFVIADLKFMADVLKLIADIVTLKWKNLPEDIGRIYTDVAKGAETVFKDLASVGEETAKDIKDTPITPTVDNVEAKADVKELYEWWVQYKAEMENEPIHIRIVRETIGPEGETQTDYAKERFGGLIRRQAGGLLPGFGGGDRIPAMLEAGEFVMRKEAVRSLGVDMLNTLNRSANAGGQQGYFVLDLRGGGKSYPLQVKKDDTADALLEALKHKDLVTG